jgi:hypothetical protein
MTPLFFFFPNITPERTHYKKRESNSLNQQERKKSFLFFFHGHFFCSFFPWNKRKKMKNKKREINPLPWKRKGKKKSIPFFFCCVSTS